MNNHADTNSLYTLGDNLCISVRIEELIIGNGISSCGNTARLDFSPLLIRLKRIEIGDNCSFQTVDGFRIDGLPSLERVEVGRKCFDNWDEWEKWTCEITGCPKISHLSIGNESFSKCTSFELSNLNSLQSIEFGEQCFQSTYCCTINNLKSLEKLHIGKRCFHLYSYKENYSSCNITSCPNLRQIVFDDESCVNYLSLNLASTESLELIEFRNACFLYANLSLSCKLLWTKRFFMIIFIIK